MLLLREVRFQFPDPRPNRYPWNLAALAHLDSLAFPTPVTFFIGDNGSGKSTVIESLAQAAGFNPEGGSRHARYDAVHTDVHLAQGLHLIWNLKAMSGFFFRAESFFAYVNYLEDIDGFDPYGGRSLHQQSHGESFLSLFRNRLNPHQPSLYLFDEPESALSPTGQLAFLRLLKEWSDSGLAQAIIATHSPFLLAFPGATIYSFDDGAITAVNYMESKPYQLTRTFLEAPDVFLRELFRAEDHVDEF
ncbi:MAG: AAA family ATPase [Sulfobacillus acidophilus]|uniref:AAA family ATPase n=1 Tax=Sulfobacillus acidophilus TaxID=53633 RepID=A0A2T2WLK8_9FIRM|nr:MAG: AAA family ATPase [Sulfobacillus acidophilus]